MSKIFDTCSYPLFRIKPNKPLPGNIYLYVGGKFIFFKKKGDTIPYERYEKFIQQRLEYLFIETGDKNKFDNWYASEIQEKKEQAKLNTTEEEKLVIDSFFEVKENFLRFLSIEVTQGSVKSLIDDCREFISNVNQRFPITEKILSKINDYSNFIGDHSTNVANLSLFLAQKLGYNQQTALENLYMGALLHDYGKVITDINNIDPVKFPRQFVKEFKRHPEVGRITLLMESGISTKSMLIIQQHHERHDGKGFPQGIQGNKIYELSKIVIFANTFENYIMDQKNLDLPLNERQNEALKRIEKDQGHLIDPDLKDKCLDIIYGVIQ